MSENRIRFTPGKDECIVCGDILTAESGLVASVAQPESDTASYFFLCRKATCKNAITALMKKGGNVGFDEQRRRIF